MSAYASAARAFLDRQWFREKAVSKPTDGYKMGRFGKAADNRYIRRHAYLN